MKMVEVNLKKLSSSNKNTLLLKPKTWCRVKFINKDSMLLVFCDREYEFDDYIEYYQHFLKIINKKKMNLLITGGCGHIGSYIAENLNKIKKIKKTYIVDNLKSTQMSSLFNTHKRNNLKFYIKRLNK